MKEDKQDSALEVIKKEQLKRHVFSVEFKAEVVRYKKPDLTVSGSRRRSPNQPGHTDPEPGIVRNTRHFSCGLFKSLLFAASGLVILNKFSLPPRIGGKDIANRLSPSTPRQEA